MMKSLTPWLVPRNIIVDFSKAVKKWGNRDYYISNILDHSIDYYLVLIEGYYPFATNILLEEFSALIKINKIDR